MPEMPSHGDFSFGEEAAPQSVSSRLIVRHRQAGSTRAGGRTHRNNMASANGEAAPRESQQAPGQADILLIEHPEQEAPGAPSRTVEISMDAMLHFLNVYAIQLRALRRRRGITRIDMVACIDEDPEVVVCSIVITGESDDSVQRVAEDIEDSGWPSYEADGQDDFEQEYAAISPAAVKVCELLGVKCCFVPGYGGKNERSGSLGIPGLDLPEKAVYITVTYKAGIPHGVQEALN